MHSGRDKFNDSGMPLRFYNNRDISEVPDLVFDDGSPGRGVATRHLDIKHFEA